MRKPVEKILVALALLFTLAWPMLLGALVAGADGVRFSFLLYLTFGGLFGGLLLLSALRGIIGS